MARILVTGAGGFIGRTLCPLLAAHGHRVVAGMRRGGATIEGAEPRVLGEIAAGRDWAGHLTGIDVIIHLAQRAHRQADRRILAGEAVAAGELTLAAARAGISRVVYISSIKAMGELTRPGRPFRAGDPPHPDDPYGRAKLASERALEEVAAATGIELVIIRPPLIYGRGVRGNFRALLWLARSGLPLPFAGIDNRRSLIFVDNLAELIALTAAHPAAAGQVLLAADGDDLSTPSLIRLLAQGQDRTARLYAVPDAVFAALHRLPGLRGLLGPLTSSLQVDDRATRELLGWSPPVTAEAALLATARAFARL